MVNQIEIFLAIDSTELNTSELTRLLSEKPDQAWNKDSTYTLGNSSRKYGFSRWAISESASSITFLEEAIDRLISRLKPLSLKIQGLPSDIRVAFSITVTESDTVFSWGLKKEHVNFLAAIGAELDTSFVIRQENS